MTPETECLVGAVPPAGITTQLERSGYRAGATSLPSEGGLAGPASSQADAPGAKSTHPPSVERRWPPVSADIGA